MKEKSGLRPRSPKNVANAGQRAPKRSKGGAHGGPRVGQGLQNDAQILPQFVEKRGPGPGAHPKGAKGTPGPPKSQKNYDFVDIFGEKIGDTVPKKRRAFRLVF